MDLDKNIYNLVFSFNCYKGKKYEKSFTQNWGFFSSNKKHFFLNYPTNLSRHFYYSPHSEEINNFYGTE